MTMVLPQAFRAEKPPLLQKRECGNEKPNKFCFHKGRKLMPSSLLRWEFWDEAGGATCLENRKLRFEISVILPLEVTAL